MRAPLKWLLIAAAAVGCSDNSSPSNGGNGPVGSVTVGNNFFQSAHNGTKNPAIDTVAVGATVTWTWTNTGSVSHSVKSDSMPGATFTSSAIQSGDGTTYTFTFTAAGTYEYDCAVHGESMNGRVVVQ
jgi:plastocyanin